MARISSREWQRFEELHSFDQQYRQGRQAQPSLFFQQDDDVMLAGVDEAGRGCLAGPVAAAAVILPAGASLPGVDDSKTISENKRYRLAAEIKKQALAWSVALVSHSYIDKHNILQASREAMRQAVLSLALRPGLVLIDALQLNDINIEQVSIIKGDATSLSIACASLLAKTERDLVMLNYGDIYPGYGFEKHKGYGTRQHLEHIKTAGDCGIHRLTFEPLKTMRRGGGQDWI